MTSKKGRLSGVWKNLYLKILQWARAMVSTLKRGLFLVCSCLGNLHMVEPQLLNYLLQGGDARRTWEMLIAQTNLKWLLMFPVTKQSQLITKPLFQALTATGRIGPATIHTGELTSAHFQLQKPKEGGAAMLVHRAMDAVSTTLLGKNAQRCNAAPLLVLFALLTYYLRSLFFPFFFRQSSYCASRVPFYPWIRCSVNTSGRDSAKLSVLVWQWGRLNPGPQVC